MKRFAFRLERLLGLRAATEREQARVFGVKARAAEQAGRRAAAGSALEREAARQAASARTIPTPAGAIANLGIAVDLAATERARSATAHVEADVEREDARRNYQTARIDRRVLERLKEVRHSDWNVEASREDRRAMDEIALRSRPNLEGNRP
jgi:flagellar export protein FliJ